MSASSACWLLKLALAGLSVGAQNWAGGSDYDFNGGGGSYAPFGFNGGGGGSNGGGGNGGNGCSPYAFRSYASLPNSNGPSGFGDDGGKMPSGSFSSKVMRQILVSSRRLLHARARV